MKNANLLPVSFTHICVAIIMHSCVGAKCSLSPCERFFRAHSLIMNWKKYLSS